MAGISAKEIKNRIKRMRATRQITNAMNMVASSKLRRAQTRLSAFRPYFEMLITAMDDLMPTADLSSPYLRQRPAQKRLYIVIAGDRGLAGGYNSSILNLTQQEMEQGDCLVLPIGKKALDFCNSLHIPIWAAQVTEAMDSNGCFHVGNQLSQAYLDREFDEIHIAFTAYVSPLSQLPQIRKLLPLEWDNVPSAPEALCEPDSDTVFAHLVPQYLGGILCSALLESHASEQAARRTAMDAATKNADEMIGNLQLKFNQSRQAAITQEITEIIAGS